MLNLRSYFNKGKIKLDEGVYIYGIIPESNDYPEHEEVIWIEVNGKKYEINLYIN